ncbi:MAG: PKD domain-containing protein, partial [Bacteroidales bacterium]|nr:PKD domain-containing protein [Bacteroidales bacterium]
SQAQDTSSTYTNTGVVDSIYQVHLEVETMHGCRDTTLDSVVVHPDPVADFNPLTTAECAPFTINDSIINLSTYPSNNTYQWEIFDKNHNLVSSFSGPAFNTYTIPSDGDTNYIRLTVQNKYGCSPDTIEDTVITIEDPVPDFDRSVIEGCSPLDVTFTNQTSPASNVNHQWDFDDGATSSQLSPTHTFVNNSHVQDTTFDVNLTATAGTGCSDSIEKPITVYPQPLANFTFDTVEQCAPAVISATNQSVYKSNNAEFIWECLNSSSVGIDTSNTAKPIFTFPDNQTNSDSTYLVQLTVISVDGCRDSIVDSVTIHKRPQALFSLDTTVCGPKALQLQNQSQNAASYQWNVSPSTNVSYSSTSANPNITLPANLTSDSINYTIDLVTISSEGCRDSIGDMVTVHPKPEASFTKSLSDSCSPVNAQFQNTSQAKNGEPLSSMTFEWTLGNGATSQTQNTSSTYTNTGVVDSIYQVNLEVETKHGCRDTTLDSVVVHPDPLADFNPSDTVSCAPFIISDSLLNLVQYQQANDTYKWTIFNKNHNTISTYSGPAFPNYTMINDNDTIFIQLIATNVHQCRKDTLEVMFNTFKDPSSDFSVDIQKGCNPLAVNFNNKTSPAGISASWDFGDGSASSNINPSHTFTNTSNVTDSTYTVELISTSGEGCADTTQKKITVYALPEANFTHISSCLGQSTVFKDSSIAGTALLNMWKWDFDDGDSSFAQNPTHIYSNSGLFNPELSVTNAKGCKDSITKPVEVYPLPNVKFNHDSVICVNDSTTITNNTTGANSYSWTLGNGVTLNQQNPIISYNSPGYYDIKLVASTSHGCIDSLSSTIRVVESPDANYTAIPDSGCAPLKVLFQNQSSGYQTSYFWNFGNGQTSNYEDPSPVTYSQGQSDTSYYSTLTAINMCGTDMDSDSILVKPQPVADFIPDKYSGCSPLTVSFSDNFTKGNPDTLKWIFGDTTAPLITTQSTFNNPVQHTFNTDTTISTYTVTYIAINECGSDTMTTDITVYPNTVDAFFNADTLEGCSPLHVNFTNHSLGFTNLFWDFGDGTFSNQTNPSHTYTSSGSYDVELIVTDSCAWDTSKITLQVHPKPVVNFTRSKDTVCVNEPLSFTNTSPNPLSDIEWDFGDGDSSSQSHPTHGFQNQGTYNVTMAGYSSLYDCPNQITKTVTVLPTPVSSITADTTIGCPPLTIDFQADSSYNTWYFGNGNTSSMSNVTQTYYNSGNYSVTLISEYLNGCRDTSKSKVVVHPKPVASFDQTVDSACGTPVDVLFTNSSQGANSYSWSFGNGVNSSDSDSLNLTFNNDGTYSDTLLAINQYGCSDTASNPLKIYPSPDADATLSPYEGCPPLTVQFTNNSNNANSFLWKFGNGNASSQSNPQHTYDVSGNYDVQLISSINNFCFDTIILKDTVNVYPNVIADFSYNHIHSPVQNSGKVQFLNQGSGASSYFWNFGDGESDTIENPLHRYMMYGDYLVRLFVENDYGCKDSTSQTISISEYNGLYVSNAFSPEKGPPEVRTFKPKGVGLKSYHIYIYNNWGNLIWESDKLANTEPAEGWDGTDKNGNPLPQDTYVWKIEAVFQDGTVWPGKTYDDGTTKKYGTVTLIR